MVAATGGHFAGVVSWERLRRLYPWLAATSRTFSLLSPFERLIEELNDWRPSVLAAYPTTLLLLGEARRAGRLRCDPEVLWSGGETLAAAERAEIERGFGARVIDGYGASECMNIAFDCGHGALHVNADWVVLEPIDSRGRPVPPGEASASVLITNLANRVQPLIRYDLGDSIRVRTAPCACGCPFPAIEVDGRRDDILTLETGDGRVVALPPLAVATVVEEGAGVHRFQVVQTGRRTLRVRFETTPGQRREAVWRAIAASLSVYLAQQGLEGIELRLDPEPPRADPVSGKLREVIGRHARRPDGGRRR
jgi:phenylacetate-coenzyme A ligase PaaK-like adenylate-forming protein